VPTLVISPLAKRGHVEHAQYETVSILKTIEQRWSLRPLSARDGRASDMAACFQ
jgi:phospholipase C